MSTKETLISAIFILFILFILLYVFNFSFLVNLIILIFGIAGLAGLFQELFKPPTDNEIYAQIDRELENGKRDRVLWRKAQSMADGGNEETATNKYVRLRFNQIKHEEDTYA